jgi:hypothetical protein
MEEELMRRSPQVLVGILAAGAAAGGVALAATPPTVHTGGTSRVSQTAAVLHGTVNPNRVHATYSFQFGPTTAYGSGSPARSAGSGARPVAVAAAATHLIPGTVYHYRLVAISRSGLSAGADRTFRTAGHPPPGVTTGPVTVLSASGADLTGAINPMGQATTWYFQWGTLGSLSQQTVPQTLRASNATQSVAWSLQGLLHPGTVYQYRLVGLHQGSAISVAASSIFMTYPARRPYPRVTAATRPRHRHLYPFVFTTTGAIGAPSSIPAQFACTGAVAIRFLRKHRLVRRTVVPVEPNCTFAGSTTFLHLPGGRRAHPPVHLRVVVRFLSTAYLAPNRTRVEVVTLG